jgi:electron transport complex protein RnfC
MRRLHTFNGGVHPEAHKTVSTGRPIEAPPLSARYVVPLRQHIGNPAKPLVQTGDTVLKGQMIGQPDGHVSVAVHAPTSGRVLAVEPRPVAHPSGLSDPCVVIEADGDDRAVEFQPLDWRRMDPGELRHRLRDAGLVGLGGAVFPSFIKLDPGPHKRIHTLVLNGGECEPWITCDDLTMRHYAAEILAGAAVMRHALGCETVLVGIEDNKPEALAAMSAAAVQAGYPVEVVAVPTIYPGGGGKQLVYTLTGLSTPSGGLTTDVGVQVFNVGTAYALWRAVVLGEPMLSRVVTVTGHVARPGNYEARIGTPIADLLAHAGGELPEATGQIIGGPMMGFDLLDEAAPVVKAINCVIVKNRQLFPPAAAPLPCIRCGACARACPADLQPFEMYWYAKAKDLGKAQAYSLFDCIECGCCGYVCPSHIPLVDYFRFAKTEIWARERDKAAADAARARHEFRDFRLEREKREKAEKFAAKAKESLSTGTAGAEAAEADPEAARKKAILAAAMEKARQAREGVQPRNVDNLTPAQQREIAEIEARRAQATEKEA